MNIEAKKPGCLPQIAMFFGIMGLVGWCSFSAEREKRNETPEIRREKFCGNRGRSDADIAAKFYVKDRLKAPSTAEFGSYDQRNVMPVGDCEFIITGYVDAQNSFGAMIRSNYSVRIKYDPVSALHIPTEIRIGP